MNFTPADSFSLAAFVLLLILVLTLVVRAVVKVPGYKKWLGIYIMINVGVSLAAVTGLTERFLIPVAPIIFIGTFVFALVVAFSKYGKDLSVSLSFTALLGLQAFRLPLELILHHWAELGVVPETMTWTGSNFDVLAGIICLLGIVLFKKHKSFIWLAQLVSFALLINVIRVAVMSAPLPFSWDLETPLLVVMYFPYALIIPGFVVVALVSHLLVFRKIF